VIRDITLPVGAHDTLDGVVEHAQLAENLGYERASIPEVVGRNGVTVLTAIAENTDRIGISNNVFSVFSRTPALLAQTAATLQEASGGRFRMGLGTSSPGMAKHWHGMEYDRPLRRLRETIEIVRQVCTGEQVDYDGEIFQVGGLSFTGPTPEEQPPLDVAMLGPKAVELTGRFADGWVPYMFTPEGLRERLADLEQGAELGDRSLEDVRVAANLQCCVLEDDERARAIGRQHLSFMIAAYGPYYRESIANQGYRDVTDTVRDRWQDGDRDRAAEAIPDDLLENVMPSGTREEVLDRIEAFESIDGVDRVRIALMDDQPIEEMNETVRALAPDDA
jgi:coenzyme F420-dependent oxidoreductase